MKKKIYILLTILVGIVAVTAWWLMPVEKQVSARMPIILVNEKTGETVASSLYMQGKWVSHHNGGTIKFIGNFSVEDISQTHVGGGDQYKLTLSPVGAGYETSNTEIDVASTAPVIKNFQLCTNRDRDAFVGTWDIYLDDSRHEASHFHFAVPARNEEEAKRVMDQLNDPFR